jgi:hypothetical protein
MTKTVEPSLMGLVPNNGAPSVIINNDAVVIRIDDARMAVGLPLPWHSKKQPPMKFSNPTRLPKGPDPIAAQSGPLIAIRLEFEIAIL